MWFFNKRTPAAPPPSEADQIRELRSAYAELAKPPRDIWARFPTIFQLAFGLLSFLGTYIGLRDIISAGDLRAGPLGDIMVFGLVALATAAMIYFLRRTVADFWSVAGLGSLLAYLMLVFFSVTFGFAFYWGRLEARQQAVSGASLRLEEFSDQVNITALGLRNTVAELTALDAEFVRLAEVERNQGGTCGDGSGVGYGPRTRHRERRAEEIRARVSQLTPRFQSVTPAVAALEVKMAEIAALGASNAQGADGAARTTLFREARKAARVAATQINAVAQDPLLKEVSLVFSRWGREYKTPNLVRRDDPRGVDYICYQVSAGDSLFSVGARLSNLPNVGAPDLPDYVGPAATREAVFRMINSAGAIGGDFWAALPLVGGGAKYDTDSDAAEAGYRTGFEAGLIANANASGSPLASIAAVGGLGDRDRFPLLIAIIVDALLLLFVVIDRRPRQFFGRFQRKLRNAIEEKLDPMAMVSLRRALNDDPGWRLLRPYRFSINDRVYIAQPLDVRHGGSPAEIAEAEMLEDLLSLWRRNGVVRRQDLRSHEIRIELEKSGSPDLAERHTQFRAYRFTDRAFEAILMRGLFVDRPAAADALASYPLIPYERAEEPSSRTRPNPTLDEAVAAAHRDALEDPSNHERKPAFGKFWSKKKPESTMLLKRDQEVNGSGR